MRVALALLVLLALPVALAQTSSTEAVVVVRLDPGEEPTTHVDRLARPPEARNAADAFVGLRDAILLRQRAGASVALELEGRLLPDRLEARLTPRGDRPTEIHLLLVEDGVARGGRIHRFVARAEAPPAAVAPGEAHEAVFPLDPAWARERLAVVAFAVAPGGNGTREAPGEVVQAALWRVTQDGPTIQIGKAPLVERRTREACAACVPGDEALTLAARTYVASLDADAPAPAYARAPTPGAVAGALGGLALAYVLLGRRAA